MKALTTFFAAAAMAASVQAYSAEGFIVADIPLQSGPDDEYPPVDQLAAGTPVNIEGCLDGWTWCDVDAGDLRGWVPGTYIEQNYGGRWVYITDYGPHIGLPVVVFSLNTYWGAHYTNRPWFGERERWASRQIQPRMPPRPQGEAHAPPPRPAQRAAQPAHAPAPPPMQPTTQPRPPGPRTNPGTTPRTVEPDRSHEIRPQPQNHAPAPPRTEHAAPAKPMSEPANRPQPAAPRSANPPRPAPEAKPKAEPKPPVKKDNQDHRDDNNGHDAAV